jgi:hypothetical protein
MTAANDLAVRRALEMAGVRSKLAPKGQGISLIAEPAACGLRAHIFADLRECLT